MIPVRVINLDRRPDRLAFMADQLAARGIAWERWPALDAGTAPPGPLSPKHDLSARALPFNRGSQVNVLNHMGIMEAMLAERMPAVCVLEDDAELAEDFGAVLADPALIPADADLVRLEAYHTKGLHLVLDPAAATVSGRAVRRLWSRHTGAAGYVVTAAGAARILAHPRIAMSIDNLLFNPARSDLARRLVTYQLHPAAVRQRPDGFASDHAAFRRAARSGAPAWRRRLLQAWFEINLWPAHGVRILTRGARVLPVTFRATAP